jgi:FtsP/CotA-like multicopper oxidase with cupredoxin domain
MRRLVSTLCLIAAVWLCQPLFASAAGAAAAPAAIAPLAAPASGTETAREICPRPPPGSPVQAPRDVRSHDGVLTLDLIVRDERRPDGTIRYCYLTADADQAPTLRLHPGDLVVLRLTNELTNPIAHTHGASPAQVHDHAHGHAKPDGVAPAPDPCNSATMSLVSTNLHFHGLTLPPTCHQDDVLKTSIQPGEAPFEYRFKIPADEPPGLYWYHPHIHGFSKTQVLGGASGALIVEGLERANHQVAGLPERVLIIRDQDLMNPDAPPAKSEPVVPKMMIDRDGDSANNGTGFGKPAKDLSVNFVPVPYPDYPPAVLEMKPDSRELWRVLNASAITYLNLAVIFNKTPQTLDIVAIDGVPLNHNGNPANALQSVQHIGLPPGARVEFMITGPPLGVHALFVTRTVDTGSGGENDPNRALATLVAGSGAPEPPSTLPTAHEPLAPNSLPWLGDVPPVRTRKLFFSEKLQDPNNPNSATDFYLTIDGQTPLAFDPASTEPNIIVKQGDVEDWIIENRSTELHAFHIHQLHFLLIDWSGRPIAEPYLRDTVNVPYYNGRTLNYPSVRLRMDFRDPNLVGTFVYHCHLLEHEDGGMMGTIRVDPAHQ